MTRLFVNRLTVIDCSFLDAKRGLVGESWQVDLELEGSLDEQGMVLDFGDIKKQVKNIIDDTFDHKLLVPANHPGLNLNKLGENTQLNFALNKGGEIIHHSPNDAVRFIDSTVVDIESLTPEVIAAIKPHMPSNVEAVRLRLWAEEIHDAYYHYSHGLKHHAGNCQRIAHGHRSRIQIMRNQQRDTELEQQWAELWCDIYVGTQEDVVNNNEDSVAFRYTSAQGEFFLSLPKQACYLINTDSTVENIAAHIAAKLQAENPQDEIRVYAYEGVDKGAIGIPSESKSC